MAVFVKAHTNLMLVSAVINYTLEFDVRKIKGVLNLDNLIVQRLHIRLEITLHS